jgi:tRNA A37 threonylcarbamoyltransferase TsaD
MSGDNAAMIGLAAYYHIQKNNVSNWRDIRVDANMKLV